MDGTQIAPAEETLWVRGTSVSYLRKGAGQPLVWLHGLWGEPGWLRHLEALSAHFQIFKVHLPGYNGSQRPPWITSVQDLAYFMLDILDEMGLSNPNLIGHCLGGWVAAEIGILRPQWLAKLCLISPLGIHRNWTKAPNLFYTDPQKLPGYFFSDYETNYDEARLFVPNGIPEWSEGFIANREACAHYVFDPYLHDPKLVQRLHHLNVPTLVIWGDEDKIVGKEHLGDWMDGLNKGEEAVIQGAGHIPFVEDPLRVEELIVSFLSENK